MKLIKMYPPAGAGSVEVMPDNVELMIRRGWSETPPAPSDPVLADSGQRPDKGKNPAKKRPAKNDVNRGDGGF